MQNETPSEVLDRIRKLMKLAGNNPNANEAALAAAKAQELMLRWKLDCATFSLDESAVEEPVQGYYDHDPLFHGVRIASWRKRLFTVICNNNACKPIITTRRGGSERGSDLRIIGTHSNVEMVRYLFGYVADEIDRLAIANRPEGLSRGEAKSWSDEFRHGCVVGVGRSLYFMRERVKAEYKATAGTQALVALDKDWTALAAYIKESGEKFRHRQPGTGTYGNASARRAGERAGSGIALNRPVGSGKARLQLTAKTGQ
jgi:hypothetical protein